jgi:hypothetical protein
MSPGLAPGDAGEAMEPAVPPPSTGCGGPGSSAAPQMGVEEIHLGGRRRAAAVHELDVTYDSHAGAGCGAAPSRRPENRGQRVVWLAARSRRPEPCPGFTRLAARRRWRGHEACRAATQTAMRCAALIGGPAGGCRGDIPWRSLAGRRRTPV